MPWLPVSAAAALICLLGAAGFVFLRAQQARLREQIEAQLSAIVDLKVSQIAAWREERLAQASVLTEDPILARALKGHLLGGPTRLSADDLRGWLDSLARHHRYAEVLLADVHGRALTTARGAAPPPMAHVARHLSDAIGAGEAVLTEIEADEVTGRVHLDLIAPIFDPDRPGVALGGLLLRVDPADFLFPQIQRWPTPSASGETIVFRVEGDSVVILNELRHRSGGPLSLRLPLADRKYLSVRVALGERGLVPAIDYRGVEVLAAGREVPQTPWLLVAKVDAQEVLAPARNQALAVGIGILLLAGGVIVAFVHWWRRQAERLERERVEAQRGREAHSRHLELLSEHADDVVLLVDEDGRIVRANDRVRDYYGWTSEELAGSDLRGLRAPGYADAVDGDIERIRREGRCCFETAHVRRDGTPLPVEVRGRGFESNGRWYFQAVVRDVSDRKRALREMSFQAEMVRSLYDAVIGLDADRVIRSWNPAAERIYGYTAEEVIGRPIHEALPTDYKGYTYEEFCKTIDRTGRMEYAVRRRRRDGEWVDIEASGAALRDESGHITGYVTANRDVTRRKAAEAALRASQERLARLIETSSEGIWIVDAAGMTEFVNARGAIQFGFAAEDAIGRPLLDVIPERGREMARADLAAVARGERVKRELCIPRPDGASTWVNLAWSPLTDAEGRAAGGVCVFMDVTEHRLAREQLLHTQKMEAVGRLASGIAHDFNNLLVSILSCSGFLMEALPAGDPRREDAREIKEAGERAAQLVRQLLAFGRKGPSRRVPVDPGAVVRGIEVILRRTMGAQVALTVSLEAEPWWTRIDPGQLEQVLVNLAVNARDAMPAGGELRIESRNVTLDRPREGHDGLAPGRYVVLTASDTGCGIAPEVLGRIFEPFFTTKEQGHGTGLGLATVYAIVEAADGAIDVSSMPDRGTTFTVYLPACDPGAAPRAGPAERTQERGDGELVLLVEDEAQVRRVGRRVLEESGFRVVEAGGAAEALAVVRGAVDVDLVLTDVVMPKMSGVELTVAIHAIRPDLPVVLMTGYAESDRLARWAGPALQKPFTRETLVARLREALPGAAPAVTARSA